MRFLRSLARLAVVAGWVITLLALAVVHTLGDNHDLGTLAMFAPRHLTPLPWLPVIALAAVRSWRWAAAAAVGAIVTLLGVAGFQLPSPAPSRAPALRVVSYNTDASVVLAERIVQDVADWDADVVLLIDCTVPVANALRAQETYRVLRNDFACVLTRHPVTGAQRIPQAVARIARAAGAGRAGRAMRVDITVHDRPVSLYAVHLESPRTALFAARHFDLSQLRANAGYRSLDSNAASRFVDRAAPGVLVLGDFNLTVESRIYRRDWGDLTNAFSAVGTGFGHTMFAGKHRVRIDHVLSGPDWQPVRAEVLRGYPSEHQPLVVDFAPVG
jgi:endonuclease/exonuclease/phosphatase (EEP) superfamily protein YafD